MTAGFVAAVLEGFETTLDAVLERLEPGRLRGEVASLQDQIATKREQFEAEDVSAPVIPVR